MNHTALSTPDHPLRLARDDDASPLESGPVLLADVLDDYLHSLVGRFNASLPAEASDESPATVLR